MDILQTDKDLKKMPYRVPEGYFSSLSKKMAAQYPENSDIAATPERTIWHILAPYTAMAAMFAIITLGGKAIMGTSVNKSEWSETEEFIYTELMPVTGPSDQIYELDKGEYIAEAGISDSDIITYLIHSGISVEEINFDNHE